MADFPSEPGFKPKGPGRPREWTGDRPEIAELLKRIAKGESLASICKLQGMPDHDTVFQMLDREPAFADRYARARTIQSHTMDDMILDSAKALSPKRDESGTVAPVTSEMVQATRVQIDAYKWRAAKLNSPVYGEKQELKHSGSIVLDRAALEAMDTATLQLLLERGETQLPKK